MFNIFRQFLFYFFTVFLLMKYSYEIKFISEISKSDFEIKFKYFEKQCERNFCIGTIQIRINNEWFIVNFNENNKTRKAVESICSKMNRDYFYNLAFQCIVKSKFFLFLLSFIHSFIYLFIEFYLGKNILDRILLDCNENICAIKYFKRKNRQTFHCLQCFSKSKECLKKNLFF